MIEVTELNVKICRLCLKAIENLGVNISQQKDVIEIVIPEADLTISNDCVVCNDCTKFLQESFTFKSKCLEIEDSIYDFKHSDDIQVNLEKVLGVKDETKSAKICRTCLGYLENNAFVELYTKNGLVSIFKKCLPEMATDLTMEPVICLNCEEKLKKIFNFLTVCAKNEEKIKFYFENSNQADHNWYSFVQSELTKAHETNEMVIKEKETFTLNVGNIEEVVLNYFLVTNDNSEGNVVDSEKVNNDSLMSLDSTVVKSPNPNQEKYIQNISEPKEPIPQHFSPAPSISNDTPCIDDEEVNKEKNVITCAEDDEVQIVVPPANTNNEVYVISDSDEDNHNTRSMEMSRNKSRRKKKHKGFKYTSTATDGDTGSDEDTDCSWVGSGGSLTDTSEDEKQSVRPVRKKQMTEKQSSVAEKPKTFDNLIYCKYCLFHTARTIDMEKHIVFCTSNPLKKEINRTPAASNVAGLLENNSKPAENSIVNHSNNISTENLSKNAPVESGSRAVQKYYRQVRASTAKKTNSPEKVAKKAALDSAGVNRERRDSSNDDCMIVETVESSANTNVAKKNNNHYPIFKYNLKNNLAVIEVLLCKYCDFNTRSILNMRLHQLSHNCTLQTLKSGYEIVCYCLVCGKKYGSNKVLESHLHKCSLNSKVPVYLFKVRNVLHCTKCCFDSANVDDVKKHLETCANIKVDTLKPGN